MTTDKFYQFLLKKFMEAKPGVLDDELENALDAWISNLEVQQLIDFVEEALAKTSIEAKQEVFDLVDPMIAELKKIKETIIELTK